MNVSDLWMTFGYGVPLIEDALAGQYRQGAHFLLLTEDAVITAELLGKLTGMPYPARERFGYPHGGRH
jgi:hypothetical protein